MKSTIIIFFLLFFNLMLFSQVNLLYRVGGRITNSDTRKNETGVTVNLLMNGKVIGSAVTSSNGKYDIQAEAPMGANLQVVYAKSGMVSKKIKFTGSGMTEEDIPAGTEFPLPTLDMDLFSERPNADFSFLNNEPVASFFWDANRMMLDYDKNASAKVRKKIEDLLAIQEKAAIENEAKYQGAISSGQSLLAQKKYDEALIKFKEASKLKPQEELPQTKITELDQLIAKEKAQAQAKQKLETEYKNLIVAADNLRDQKQYEDAVSKYREALSKKVETYPKTEIVKLTKLIANQKAEASKQERFESLKQEGLSLMESNKLNEAKAKFLAANAIKQDPSVTQKIKEINAEIEKEKQSQAKKQQYDLAIKTADNLFNSGKFEQAKVKYQSAISIDQTQEYPKQKLTDIAAELAKLQKEKEFKAQINQLISEGNSAMNVKDLNLAKAKFEEVLNLESNNEVAKQKLRLITQQLSAQKNNAEKEQMFNQLKSEGFELVTSKKYKEAKIKLEQALAIKSDAQISQKIVEINKFIDDENKIKGLDNQYNKSIQEAKAYEADKKYENALAKYKVASSLKPKESLPKQKISELKKIISSQAQAATDDKNYDLHIGNGNKYLAQQNFDIAISEYEKALSFKPNDSFAKSKINEASQLKDNIAKAAKAGAEKTKQFDEIIILADKLYRQKKYLDAKTQYEKALTIIPTDLRAQNQIKECVRLEKAESNKEVDASYRKLLTVADKKLASKDYDKAKEYYERALTIRSNDPYPKTKLKEIERLKNPQPTIERKQPEPIEPEKLQPLGVIYEKSEKEAIDDLRKAEIERKRLKEKGLEKGADEVIALYEEKENQKKVEARAGNQQVVELRNYIDDEIQNRKEEFQEVVEQNKKVRREQESFNEQSNSFENTDRLNIQTKTDIMKLENDIETTDKLAQYEGKTAEMKIYQTIHLNKLETSFNEEHIEKIEGIDEIKKVGDQIEQAQIQNNDEKIDADQKIIRATKNNTILVEEANEKKRIEALTTKKEIVVADREQEKIMIKDVSNAADLNDNLEVIKENVVSSSASSYNNDQNQGRETTDQVVELNKNIASEQKGNEETLRNSTEKLKLNKKGLYSNSNSTYNNEKVKYLSNQGNIGRKYNKIEDDVTNSNYKNVESGSALKDKANELIDNNTQQVFDKEQMLINAQQKLNQTSQTSGSQEKVLQPNALGQEYPEGVSQETFNQNDENGLMKAINTRRIVVIEGHGDVYVRTQTASATTYSKNGEPSSERVWQKETQGPHLKKNY